MKISIKLKLIISYVTISVIIVSSFLAASNLMLERQFQKYVTQNQEQLNLEIVNQIAEDGDSGRAISNGSGRKRPGQRHSAHGK